VALRFFSKRLYRQTIAEMGDRFDHVLLDCSDWNAQSSDDLLLVALCVTLLE
tara:strand:- start:758 stop:913 length:156 start_codon:yes stop_codon:yes gene_type:complete